MASNSKIEWTDHTFNPWEGCTKVGPGCDNCYAESRNARFSGGQAVNWGSGAPRRRTSAANWRKPAAWNDAHFDFFAQRGRRQRVFCASLADVFDNEVDPQWRRDLFDLIELTPNLDWLLLTKRIGNVVRMLPSHDWAGRGNVWLGATITSQAEADRDIPKLLATPARVRFLSMEPLLGAVDIAWALGHRAGIGAGFLERGTFSPGLELLRPLDWVIAGGESGPIARPMHPNWARSLRDQCKAAGVPFLFKQHGDWVHLDPAGQRTASDAVIGDPSRHCAAWPDGSVGHGDHRVNGGPGVPLFRVGKNAAGRLLDGRIHNEFPCARYGGSAHG